VLPILAKAPPRPPTAPDKPRAAHEAAAVDPKAPAKAAAPAHPMPSLTAEQRAALPAIAVSGTSYSSNPAHRMLIANGQVVKEGQELSPGLTLESIGQHSAIFNQRGTRFNVNY
jgi:general secretion pathway protein B